MAVLGRAWVYGDKIDTDLLAPGAYMRGSIQELASHCLEAIDPHFAGQVQPGDVVVGGEAFGIGSSREQAAEVLKVLGVRVVIAKSFARIFYRNALNLGLPALECPQADRIDKGDMLAVDPRSGVVENRTKAETYQCDPLPDFLMAMIEAGGLMAQLEAEVAARKENAS